jgi:7-carboxy-7-deazaguanine synthase
MGKLYSVAEHFFSFQGEGLHIGRAAYFVRLYGCDVQCTWCDSAFTWKKELRPKIERLSAEQISSLVSELHRDVFVVLTGGEPCLYDLTAITDAIRAQGRKIHLETAGHLPIRGEFDCITVSPKWMFGKEPLEENMGKATQIKLIVSGEKELKEQLQLVGERCCDIWLQPEESRRNQPEVLASIANAVKNNPRLRAGWQLHKDYFVR